MNPVVHLLLSAQAGERKKKKKGKILRKSVKEQCSREKRKENIQSIVSRPPMSLVWFGSEFCGQSSVWKSLYSRIPSHLWRNIRWVMWFHIKVVWNQEWISLKGLRTGTQNTIFSFKNPAWSDKVCFENIGSFYPCFFL